MAIAGITRPVVLPLMGASSVDDMWGNWFGKLQAVGPRDVMIIESEEGLSHPDAVPRRPAIELTEELRKDLEDQGIPRAEQQDDLTIMKARYQLPEDRRVARVERSGVGGEMLTKKTAMQKIAIFMQQYEESGGGGTRITV